MKHLFLFILITSFHYSIAQAPNSNLEKGKKLFNEKKFDEAKKLFETIDDDNSAFGESQFYLGRIAFDAGEYSNASEYFEEAVEANENNPNYHYWLGNAYGREAQNSNMMKQGYLAPKIKTEYEAAAKLDSKNIDARIGLIEFYTQAPGFMGGSFEKATAMAEEIKKLNKAQGHNSMALVHNRSGKPELAEKEYISAIAAAPDSLGYQFSLSYFYANGKQYEKAFTIFDEMLKKFPTNKSAVYQIGRISSVSGLKLDKGEAALREYLKYKPKPNEPSLAFANYRLGTILEKKGNKIEAKKYYQEAVKLDSKHKEANEALDRLK